MPVFWACSTDAVGFLSLAVAQVGPVRDFGVMTAIGSMSVLLSAILLVPGLALLGRFDADPHRVWGDGVLGLELTRLVHSAQRKRHAAGHAPAGPAGGDHRPDIRLEIETDFTKNFRRSSPIVQSYAFIEEELGGPVYGMCWSRRRPHSTRTSWNAYVLFEQHLRGLKIVNAMAASDGPDESTEPCRWH